MVPVCLHSRRHVRRPHRHESPKDSESNAAGKADGHIYGLLWRIYWSNWDLTNRKVQQMSLTGNGLLAVFNSGFNRRARCMNGNTQFLGLSVIFGESVRINVWPFVASSERQRETQPDKNELETDAALVLWLALCHQKIVFIRQQKTELAGQTENTQKESR